MVQFLTDFADLAVVLPLALCVAAYLALSGYRRGAMLWLATLGGLFAFMLVAKLAVLGCAPRDGALESPSGHTASATFLYGSLAALTLRLRPAMTVAAGVAFAALFGASRVLLHAHTLADVVAGGGAGVAALAVFALAFTLPTGGRPWRLLLACVPVALLLHGARLDLEPRLRATGHLLGLTLCPPQDTAPDARSDAVSGAVLLAEPRRA